MCKKIQFYIDLNCQQRNHIGERICGDVFLNRRIDEENRVVAVLSDGMGHGVKANMLATLTATMAMNFTYEHKDPRRIAEIIMKVLPVCSVRHMSYSTFTIIDIEVDGKVRILEYDNPSTQILRGDNFFYPEWQCILLDEGMHKRKELKTCSFYPKLEDRIVFWSDGVIQSGLGMDDSPFGWGLEAASKYLIDHVKKDKTISSKQLAAKLVNKAYQNDCFKSKDDTSCGVIYFREPRKLLLMTGPPYDREKDDEYVDLLKNFTGKKILCGATTSEIISRGLEVEIEDQMEFTDPELPPISKMEGVDLVTEGILTLSKVARILENYQLDYRPGFGPADQIVRCFQESDEIQFVIGTRINIAHQDPTLPVDLEIRRTVVKRIARFIEDKLLKVVKIKYL
ncbi:MAG: SpoIIE family protein phosphatase [Bacteroidales bacterium]